MTCRVSAPGKSLTLILLLLFLTSLTSTSTAADNPYLTDDAVVIQKAERVISPGTRTFLAERDGDRAKIWVFFTDKGVRERSAFTVATANLSLSEKAAARRAKVGMDRILFVDLPVVQSYVEAIEATGAAVRRTSRYLNAASFEADLDQLDRIAELPFVAEIRPLAIYTRKPIEESSAADRLGGEISQDADATAVDLNYGESSGQLSQIKVTEAHQLGLSGQGVTLAIFDTGFRKTHEAFAQHYVDGRVLAEYDFIFDDDNTGYDPVQEPLDIYGQWDHGTLIWSVTGGQMPGRVYGPAYNATFILCKTEDTRSETQVEEDNWVAALEWVDGLGADVVTSSLAYVNWYDYSDFDGLTATTTIAANTAASLGIVVCNAMANSGPGAGTLHAPADAFDILAVGAVNSAGDIANFSSRGPTFDGRTKPEVCAQGVATFGAYANGDDWYRYANGTSLSTPLVAGAAALLIEARPQFPPQLIRQALMETANRADSPDNNYGWGIVNLQKALTWGKGPDVGRQFLRRSDDWRRAFNRAVL
jgi:subtilisin family serine protease